MAVRRQIPKAVLEANETLWERVSRLPHSIRYEYSTDHLFVTFGTPAPSASVPVGREGEEAYLHVAFGTHEITGWDIEDFSTFARNHSSVGNAYRAIGLGRSWELAFTPAEGNEEPASELIVSIGRYLRAVHRSLKNVFPTELARAA